MTAHSSSPEQGRVNHPRAPLPPINFKALADALLSMSDTLVPSWLDGGKRNGHEWVCGSLSGGAGGSCSVNLVSGAWADFSSDEKGGDLVSLYAAINGVTMGKAAVELAHTYGLESVAGVMPEREGATSTPRPPRPAPPPAAPKPRESEGWQTVRPVPHLAPAPTFKHYDRHPDTLTHAFEYRSGADTLHGYVVRFRTSDGGKDTLPYTWCQSARDGTLAWRWKQWDEPRPLYLPGKVLPALPTTLAALTVVVVEGERKADVLHALLDAQAPGVYFVASWPGGSKAWAKADWAWLQGARTVLLWPDCDAQTEAPTAAERKACTTDADLDILKASKPLLPEAKQPGMKAMVGIGNHLHTLLADDAGTPPSVSLLRIPAPGLKPSGWDAADAIETDGWGVAEVLALFGTAYPCPAVGADAPAPAGAQPGADAGAAAAAGGGGRGAGKKIDVPADAEDDDAGGKPMPWWLSPYYDADKGRWLTSRKLVIAALTYDPALAGVLGVNQLSNNIEARRDWPWAHGAAGAIRGSTDLALGRYLSSTYGLPSINRAALLEAIETVANECPFHPVQEYLQGLQHDGRKRVDEWLVFAIGETRDTLDPVVYEYLCHVGRFWLLGMVYRVMEPGCKFDYCVVLEGPGGLGKSTLVEALAGVAWFSDTHFDVSRGKEGQEQVQGLWVYEIAELSQFGKAEIQLIKAFISAKIDRYRPSYGRVVEAYPRQCLLVGTTNEKTYLRDRTGNRRFWPVPVRNRIAIPWVRERRDQLMAEAFDLYMQGVDYYPSPELEARLFVPMQESRLVDTAVMGELLAVLTRPPQPTGIGAVVNELADFVTLSQLALALGVDAAKSSAQLELQIRGWMEHEGWTKAKKQINGARHWGWARPKDWPPQDTDAATPGTPGAGAADPSTEEADDAPF